MFGLLLATGLNPNVANIIQAIVYTLATRLGAPGRNRYMLVMALLVGLVGGWVTGVTGGIAAAFIGHSITRFAVFLTTGHAGQFLPRGREEEEIDKKRRPPDGWRVIGPREPAIAGPVSRRRESPADRRRTAVPPVALYVHFPFCVSVCPYCDFVVYAGSAARGPRNRVGGVHRPRSRRRSSCAPTRSTRVRRRDRRRPPLESRLPRRRDAVAPPGR